MNESEEIKLLLEKLEEIAYHLGQMQIFKVDWIYQKIHELEVNINQFLLIHSEKHRIEYCKVLKIKPILSRREVEEWFKKHPKDIIEFEGKKAKKLLEGLD